MKPPLPWAEPFEVRRLKIYEDPRGYLFEVIRFLDDGVPAAGQVYVYSVEPGHRRGDHYHLKKREWLTCVHGSVTALLSDGKGHSRAVRLSAKTPEIIYAGPGTSHALLNEGTSAGVILSYSSEPHSDEAPDTYPSVSYPEYEG
jgi:UDP-2-acetamido-2,6-beta-L-arabino-hexul-4-ose reductase